MPKNSPTFLLLLAFHILFLSSFAQKKKVVNVGIAPFEWSSQSADPIYVSLIYDHVKSLLVKYPTVKLVARDSWKAIQEERELLKTEPFILSETIQQGRSAGAEKLVTGKIYLIDIQRINNNFKISFNLYLAIADVEEAFVIDNITLSPNGIQDSDKFIQVLRAMSVVNGTQVLTPLMNTMELADALETSQEIGALDEKSFFEKALEDMDKNLIPFFDYYFGTDKSGYKPADGPKTPVVGFYREPSLNLGKLREGEMRYRVVEMLSPQQLRIHGGEMSGITKYTELYLEAEFLNVGTTLSGTEVSGLEDIPLGTMKFVKYEGDFSIFELERNSKKDLNQVLIEFKELKTEHSDAILYAKEVRTKEIKVKPRHRFDIRSLEKDNQLKIVGSVEDGITPKSKFSLVKETFVNFTDINGNAGNGISRRELATFKVLEDRETFHIIVPERELEVSVKDMVGTKQQGVKPIVYFKLKNY
ncbi:MAG: hypothetical protein AAFW00_08015 [Bacteroidota bacterium]